MKKILLAALLMGSVAAFAQDIPKGVVYKKADDKINNNAKNLLQRELKISTTTYSLFDKVLYIGPNLWQRYKNIEAIKNIDGGNIQFKVRTDNTTTTLPGKLIQKKSDYKIIWKTLLSEVNNKKMTFRKLNSTELKYYWTVIFYDIEEPVFIIEVGQYKYLIQLIKSNFKILWLDEA
jgi:hypothetical protein